MDDATRACAGVRDLMLEADPAELRGTGSSQVAAHVCECIPCRRLADGMLTAQLELATSLDALTAQRANAVGSKADLSLSQIRGASPAPATGRVTRVPGSMSYRRAAGVLLAAAAALVLILYPRSGAELARPEPRTERIAMAADRPVVSVTSGDEVVIMNTTNPNITVVWYMDRESQR